MVITVPRRLILRGLSDWPKATKKFKHGTSYGEAHSYREMEELARYSNIAARREARRSLLETG
jgi:hypothetical protein